ncbi:sigma 54-interacting transcriptional regulator [Desulfoprunum benzoelyticum]|uniref:Transcriptional regulator with PAS, ATPase and Fis domain n=1 Tax=Desulfoprunum benzoelyticum TaxID=1506996 RepID=A0A840UWT1_9BACT|nr:sigma 54-interacting transcriptional regulator [Desulfoprunum benzoelyticum]MBB5349393.1 transcriptional regulator with PAS, ATPase and Fis domain [Desulfoprunum benzoelyticum]MBM9531179.1 sigma 54-interacting transcriptional regulator [Desulfoprunum benzoelyticum]
METPAATALIRKAQYCRCGIVFSDRTGRVIALSRDFGWPENLQLEAGFQLPAELSRLHPGQWVFWGEDWFVEAAGRQTAEILVFRRLRMADQLLGPYGESATNEEMVRMVLNNPYEGLTVVDTEGRVTFLSAANERWLNLQMGEGAGIALASFAPASRLAEVARTGVADDAQIVDLQGKTKITVNLPIKKDNRVIGAVGRILFQNTEQLEKLAGRVRAVELQVERYETLLDEMRGHLYTFDDILTANPLMLGLIDQARRIAAASATVLILGESGTGKELFAQAIHQASNNNKGPFIAINCGAIPSELIESELFGYEEGAFSGARKKGKPGKFELASGGTLFLDEVGELPLESQAKLLRVLEERRIDRLGGTTSLPVDFRLVTATNSDLFTLAKSGKFRSDLYYRINEYPIEIPPLRSRPEDIPLLARHFLAEVSRREQLPMLGISEEALQILAQHSWPGNVRELRGLMRQMTWKAQGRTIEPHHLPSTLNKGRSRAAISGTLAEQLDQAERNAIVSALQAAEGNRALASRLLGIHRTALYKKMARLGIDFDHKANVPYGDSPGFDGDSCS